MTPESIEQKMSWDNDSPTLVSPDNYSQVDFKIDIKNLSTLNKKEKQIIMFLFQK